MENNALRGFSDSSFENVFTRHICAKYKLFPTYTLLVFCAQSPYYTTQLAVFSEYLKMTLVCQKVIIHQYATYLANIITPYTRQRNFHSSNKHFTGFPTFIYLFIWGSCIASAAPILWNKLPDKLTAETDTSSFMKSLQMYLFHHSCKKVLVGCIESLLDYYVLYKCILLLLALYCINSFICLRIPWYQGWVGWVGGTDEIGMPLVP